MSTNIRNWYDAVLQQMAAEAYPDQSDLFGGANPAIDVLMFGSNSPTDQQQQGNVATTEVLRGTTRMTATQAEDFLTRYEIVSHLPNTASGFSGTLIREIATGAYTLSFRSTEYLSAAKGGDRQRDFGTNVEIGFQGFAFGQIASMESYYEHLIAGESYNAVSGQWEIDPALDDFSLRFGIGNVGGTLNISGYSLSGNLAYVFAAMHPEVDHTYVFNATGLGNIEQGDLATMVADLRARLANTAVNLSDPSATSIYDPILQPGIYAQYQSIVSAMHLIYETSYATEVGQPNNKITQLFGEAAHNDFQVVANSGLHVPATKIFIEDQPDVQNWILVGDDSDFGKTHSITLLVDSLAVMSVFERLGLDMSTQQGLVAAYSILSAGTAERGITIIREDGVAERDSLEAIVAGLHKLVTGSDVTLISDGGLRGFSNISNREEFYKALDVINAEAASQPALEFESLVDKTSNDLILAATNPDPTSTSTTVYRYALKALNPFAVSGVDYSQHNTSGELELHVADAGARSGSLTQRWIEDRAAFLAWANIANRDDDTSLVSTDVNGDRWFYTDLPKDYTVRLVGEIEQVLPDVILDELEHHRVIFAGDAAAGLIGADLSDKLYGGFGTNYLVGNRGDDHLEAGAGLDVYQYGSFKDVLEDELGNEYVVHVNDGSDTVLDTDGVGLLRYSFEDATGLQDQTSLIVDASIKLSDSQWQSADELFTYTKTEANLRIDINDGSESSLLIEDFRDGDFFIRFGGEISLDNLLFIEGDLAPVDGNPSTAEIDLTFDALGNVITSGPEPGRADILKGSDGVDGHDRIVAGGGRDQVIAKGGDDVVESGSGGTLDGGEFGGDLVDGGDGNDWLYADLRIELSEAIVAGRIATPTGLKGDLLSGRAGDDTLVGGADNDLLVGGTGADILIGGAGDDNLGGGADWQPIIFTWSYFQDGIFRQFGGISGTDHPVDDGGDTIYAGIGDDYAWGGYGNDVIFGEAGNDTLLGQWGSDILVGGAGNDKLYGESSRTDENDSPDILDGGEGDDLLVGRGGDDILIGGPGNDDLQGGAGRDIYIFNRGDGVETISDLPDDALDAAERSVIILGDRINSNEVTFTTGSMVIDFGPSDPGDANSPHDQIHFPDFDHIDPFSTPVLGELRFADGSVMSYDDILEQGFDIDGTEFDDNDSIGPDGVFHEQLGGTGVTDRIRGFAGNDTLNGGGGNDTLDGGTGNDTLRGGDGDDVLLGAEGTDTLWGDAGDDTLDGGAGADFMRGEAGADTLLGGDDDDVLWGDHFSTPIEDQGADNLSGGLGDDELLGYGGDDLLDGGEGTDRLEGGAGNDTLAGGAGADELLGGTGSDSYFVSPGDGADTITDFNYADGSVDRLAFSENVLVSDVRIGRTGQDMTVAYSTTGDVALVQGYFQSLTDEQGIEEIHFADLTVWDASLILERLTTGTDGVDVLGGTDDGDVLRGFGADDTLNGWGGDDTLEGGAGTDTYVLGWNAGTDTIVDDFAEQSVVQLANGMRFDDLDAVNSGSDLYLGVLDIPGALHIQNYDAAPQNWTVRDDAGEVRSMPAVLDAIANRPVAANAGEAEQDFVSVARRRFIADLSTFGAQGDISINEQASDAATIFRISPSSASEQGDNYYVLPVERIIGGPSDNFFDLSYSGVMAVDAGAGDDFIYAYGFGAEGSGSFLYGNAGDDRIIGSFDRDVLVGGPGSDYLNGIDLSDTYIVFADDVGIDIIDEATDRLAVDGSYFTFTGGDADEVRFASGLSIADFSFSWGSFTYQTLEGLWKVSPTLDMLWAPDRGVRLVMPQPGNYYDTGVETIKFADGTVLTLAQLEALAPPRPTILGSDFGETLEGTLGPDRIYAAGGNDFILARDGDDTIDAGAGDDFLFGEFGDDILDGGPGNDVLDGGWGNDTIVFGYGSGQDTWNEAYAFQALETLKPNVGVTPDDLIFERSGENLVMRLRDSSDQMTITRWLAFSGHPKFRVEFADGTVWDETQIWEHVPPAFVIGTEGPDTLWPLLGRNTMLGLGGDDALHGSVYADLLDGGSGNDWLWGESGDDILEGGTGADVLIGSAGDDFLDGGAGDDQLQGDAGNDIYLFGFGSGHDRISGGAGDVIRLDAGVTPADLVLSRTGFQDNDIRIALSSGTDSVTLLSWFFGTRIDGILFDDGTFWDHDAINRVFTHLTGTEAGERLVGSPIDANVIIGLGGNDLLEGGDKADYIDGGIGDDNLLGLRGEDTYVFGHGYGQDAAYEIADSPNDIDTVQMLPGVSPDDVDILPISGIPNNWNESLVVELVGGDSLVLVDWLMSEGTRIERISFADGTVWDEAELFDRAFNTVHAFTGTDGQDQLQGTLGMDLLEGLAGDDILRGLAGDDFLDGGTGEDIMIGAAGDDTYYVDDTGDTVIEYAGEGIDTVNASIAFTLGSNLENLTLAGTVRNGFGNELDNALTGNGAVNNLFGLAGNDVLDGAAGADFLDGGLGDDRLFGGTGDDALYGGDGNDLLYGGEGADVLIESAGSAFLDGGAGNDVLVGGTGNGLYIGNTGTDTLAIDAGMNVIAVNAGDGPDIVKAGKALANTLSLGGGIAYADLNLSKSGADLVLNAGGSDNITLKSWYSGSKNKSLVTLQVIAEAMAGYDPDSSDPLLNQKVQLFDFAAIATAFDAAGQVNNWGLNNALGSAHLGGSDTDAYGGAIAYRYGIDGDLSALPDEQMSAVISATNFASAVQPIAGAPTAAPLSSSSLLSTSAESSGSAQPLSLATNATTVDTSEPSAIGQSRVSQGSMTRTTNPVPAAPQVDPGASVAAGASSTISNAPVVPESATPSSAADSITRMRDSIAAHWLATEGSAEPAPVRTRTIDDAIRMQRQWAAIHRWLDSDMPPTDEVGAPGRFTPARIDAGLLNARGGDVGQRVAANSSAAAHGLKPLDGLSDGFKILG